MVATLIKEGFVNVFGRLSITKSLSYSSIRFGGSNARVSFSSCHEKSVDTTETDRLKSSKVDIGGFGEKI